MVAWRPASTRRVDDNRRLFLRGMLRRRRTDPHGPPEIEEIEPLKRPRLIQCTSAVESAGGASIVQLFCAYHFLESYFKAFQFFTFKLGNRF